MDLERAREHEERIAEAERLMIRGEEMLVAQREAGRETDQRISALVDAQLASEQAAREMKASLKAYFDSLGKSGNGH